MSEVKDLVEKVDEVDFRDCVLDATETVVVMFCAEWSAPCRMMLPIMQKVASERKTGPLIVRIEVDQAPGLVARYGIQGLPTFVSFRDGEVVEATAGTMSKGDIQRFLDRQAE